MKRFLLFFCSILCFAAAKQVMAQSPKFEFRAAWIATVDNIDWPSKEARSSVWLQKKEFIDLLDMHARNGLNAVIVQVRPAADAFYPSSYYDPLEFMITETHKRGMEFHAWFNPYRAVFKMGVSTIAPSHVTRLHPNWFLTYGDKRYFDPSKPEVRQYVTNIVEDVVKRYDIDAIHFDDYFYPYRIAGKEFPDQAMYLKYGRGMEKEAWRRSNVDTIIRMLSEVIKKHKPHVQFGISPFGVWRNKDKDPEGSETKAGQTNYDDLYADILLWLKKGWIDYVAPQLYWEIGHKLADYETLLQWWAMHSYGRHLYIGHGIYRAGTNAAWRNPNEIPEQILMLRDFPDVQGSIYFSSKSFKNNPNGWNDSLRNTYYKYPALIPPMKWIDSIPPPLPEILSLNLKAGVVEIKGKAGAGERVKAFVVYKMPYNGEGLLDVNYIQRIIPANGSFTFTDTRAGADGPAKYAVTTIDMANNESLNPVIISLNKNAAGAWQLMK
jgi:uncharacterized lipoprotein YddW (UPF0748 family)